MTTIDPNLLVTATGGVTQDPDGRTCTDPRPGTQRPGLPGPTKPFPPLGLPNPLTNHSTFR